MSSNPFQIGDLVTVKPSLAPYLTRPYQKLVAEGRQGTIDMVFSSNAELLLVRFRTKAGRPSVYRRPFHRNDLEPVGGGQ